MMPSIPTCLFAVHISLLVKWSLKSFAYFLIELLISLLNFYCLNNSDQRLDLSRILTKSKKNSVSHKALVIKIAWSLCRERKTNWTAKQNRELTNSCSYGNSIYYRAGFANQLWKNGLFNEEHWNNDYLNSYTKMNAGWIENINIKKTWQFQKTIENIS